MSFQYPINVYKDTLRNGDDIETLSSLTYNYQWPAVLECLENHPDLVNSCRLPQRWTFQPMRMQSGAKEMAQDCRQNHEAKAEFEDQFEKSEILDKQYRVTLMVWHKQSIQGQCNNHTGS